MRARVRACVHAVASASPCLCRYACACTRTCVYLCVQAGTRVQGRMHVGACTPCMRMRVRSWAFAHEWLLAYACSIAGLLAPRLGTCLRACEYASMCMRVFVGKCVICVCVCVCVCVCFCLSCVCVCVCVFPINSLSVKGSSFLLVVGAAGSESVPCLSLGILSPVLRFPLRKTIQF